jgi:hypothetical protein
MMRPFLLSVAAALAALFTGTAARADYVYEFDSGSTPMSSFTVAAGSTVTVNVYLKELDTNGTLQSQGLQSAGVNVISDAPSAASVASASAIAANPGFANQSNSVSGGTATLQADNFGNANIVFPASGDPNRILLGSFTFTGNAAGTANLTAQNIDPTGEFSYNVTGSGNSLDSLISNGTATITVTAVPEPGGLLLGGLAAAGLGVGAWRRWRKRVLALA